MVKTVHGVRMRRKIIIFEMRCVNVVVFQSNLCGEAGGRAAGDGLARDMASEHRVERIEETRFSSSNWTNE